MPPCSEEEPIAVQLPPPLTITTSHTFRVVFSRDQVIEIIKNHTLAAYTTAHLAKMDISCSWSPEGGIVISGGSYSEEKVRG